ncbi:MAG TPA: hypothetical protein VNH83_10525 [Bryobacteraceae bacterium]|nr:hypothetical protein [Bryobacteraceae bacterium]
MTGERTDPDQRALSLAQHMGNASEALSALLVEVIDSNGGLALQKIVEPCHWTLCSTLSYWRSSGKASLGRVRKLAARIILCDGELAGDNWQQLRQLLAQRISSALFLVTSELWGERLWSEVLNLGGNDALATPFRLEAIPSRRDDSPQCFQLLPTCRLAHGRTKEVGA